MGTVSILLSKPPHPKPGFQHQETVYIDVGSREFRAWFTEQCRKAPFHNKYGCDSSVLGTHKNNPNTQVGIHNEDIPV